MSEINLDKVEQVHFIGIGGIGMSALARYFLDKGVAVSGSDIADSELLADLEEEGVETYVGHAAKQVPETADLVIYTLAIPEDNEELMQAQGSSAALMTYPEALGEITRDKKVVAVSGTHGKTTTVAMITHILEKAQKSPSMIVGSLLYHQNQDGEEVMTNYVGGSGEIFVIEACEYKRSFLKVQPDIAVITNLEEEHLDYYQDLQDIQEAYKEFAQRIPNEGGIVVNSLDKKLWEAVKGIPKNVYDYSDVKTDFSLSVPGDFNVGNAKAAIKTVELLGVEQEEAKEAISSFSGTWRRFEFKGKLKGGALLYDDYAHHPTEIKATLKAFRHTFSSKDIKVVFQPHLYSRTEQFIDKFQTSFENADKLLILPIYGARENQDDFSTTSADLHEQISGSEIVRTFEEASSWIEAESSEDSVIVTMGAGDVYKVAERLRFSSEG